jgi:hypothetical protein
VLALWRWLLETSHIVSKACYLLSMIAFTFFSNCFLPGN